MYLGGDKVVLDKMHVSDASSCCCACVSGVSKFLGEPEEDASEGFLLGGELNK
jgi:hypothetical protein